MYILCGSLFSNAFNILNEINQKTYYKLIISCFHEHQAVLYSYESSDMRKVVHRKYGVF